VEYIMLGPDTNQRLRKEREYFIDRVDEQVIR
jgi:hypothetical protein